MQNVPAERRAGDILFGGDGYKIFKLFAFLAPPDPAGSVLRLSII
jgi:hypothetical protein